MILDFDFSIINEKLSIILGFPIEEAYPLLVVIALFLMMVVSIYTWWGVVHYDRKTKQ